MTQTEKMFFKVPIKVYDVYDARNASIKEEKDYEKSGKLESIPIAYTEGYSYIRPEDIISISDYYGKEQDFEDVHDNGFTCSLILLKSNRSIEEIESTWVTKKFLENLDKWYKERELI